MPRILIIGDAVAPTGFAASFAQKASGYAG
jgi:hypothetical protein